MKKLIVLFACLLSLTSYVEARDLFPVNWQEIIMNAREYLDILHVAERLKDTTDPIFYHL